MSKFVESDDKRGTNPYPNDYYEKIGGTAENGDPAKKVDEIVRKRMAERDVDTCRDGYDLYKKNGDTRGSNPYPAEYGEDD